MTTPNHFQLVVIGGGSGGVACARRAAFHGVKVAVIEKQYWGGTCVNVGCVPKKIMWLAAEMRTALKHSKEYGFKTGDPEFNWNYLVERRNASVKRLQGIYADNLAKENIAKFNGTACFAEDSPKDGPHKLEVVSVSGPGKRVCLSDRNGGWTEYVSHSQTETKSITADVVVIATGGSPVHSTLPGNEFTTDSDGFFALETQPKKVAVIGAGYIAVELAGVLNTLGSETHLFFRGETVLRKFDEMLRIELDKSMKKQGMHLHSNCVFEGFENSENNTKSVLLKDREPVTGFEVVIVATGRKPAVENLKLDRVGVQCKPTGHILVNNCQETTVKGVFALGDVCGRVELTPMAIAAGRRLADRLYLSGGETLFTSYDLVPTVVFSHPPIGTVGLTEEEAAAKYGRENIVIYSGAHVNMMFNVFDIAPADKPRSYIKLICTLPTERIVGMHVIGIGADELLQGFGVALKMGATKFDFDNCVAIHPSSAEEVVTLPPWGLPHPSNSERPDGSKLAVHGTTRSTGPPSPIPTCKTPVLSD